MKETGKTVGGDEKIAVASRALGGLGSDFHDDESLPWLAWVSYGCKWA